MPRQLALDLPARVMRGREDFLVGPSNALAVATLDATGDWPGGKLVLIGPEGSGKSHLAALWADEHGAEVIEAQTLGAMPKPGMQALAVRLSTAGQALAVENAGRIGKGQGGGAAAEEALFHLHNLVLAGGGRLLITADRAPSAWGLRLPDLASRMQAAGQVRIAAPDDQLLAGVLVKLFADRQIAVQPALIDWLLPRMERSFAAARRLVADLDALALERRRPVGRALAAELLDSA